MSEHQSREDFAVGEADRMSREISEADIRTMADLTSDTNPIHLDEEFASRTRFGGRIAHGLFCSGLISAVLGTRLPGPGTIYLREILDFLQPVRAGDTLTAEVEVTAWDAETGRITLDTRCLNQQGEKVAAGESVLLIES